MNISLLIWIGFAVGLAWAVGAYSRLNRLRDQVVRARTSLLKYSRQYDEMLKGGRAQDPIQSDDTEVRLASDLQASGGMLEELKIAVDGLQALLLEWDGAGTQHAVPTGIGAAYDRVQASVEALASAPADLAGELWPPAERMRWTELTADIRMRRTRYNVHAADLNEAAAQMPAALLARMLGVSAWEFV